MDFNVIVIQRRYTRVQYTVHMEAFNEVMGGGDWEREVRGEEGGGREHCMV